MNSLNSRVHAVSRITVAFVWMYHGLVPKLLGPHSDELYLASIHGIPDEFLPLLLKMGGVAEIAFGVVVIVFWRSRWPFVVSVVILVLLLIDVAIVAPEYLLAAFNPVTLNLSVIGLCVIGFLTTEQGTDSSN